MDTQAKINLTTNSTTSFTLNSEMDVQWFSISEYVKCMLAFECDDEDVQLWIECPMNELGYIKLQCDECISLIDLKEDSGYVSGKYLIKLMRQNYVLLEGVFEVFPHNISVETLNDMCACIEDKARGLTKNSLLKRRVRSSLLEVEETPQQFLYLLNHHQQLLQTLDYIGRHPIEQFVQSERLGSSLSKQRRMMMQKFDERPASSKKTLTYQTLENQYLKKEVDELVKMLATIRLEYEKLYVQPNRRLDELSKSIEHLERVATRLDGTWNIEKANRGMLFELELKKAEYKKYEKRIEQYDTQLQPLEQVYNKAISLIHDSWMRDVSTLVKGVFPRSLLHHQGYSNLHQFKKSIFNPNQVTGYSVLRHPTQKLFEYYVWLLVIEILETREFSWTSGWLKLHPNSPLLESGDFVMMEHSTGASLKVSYDCFLNTVFEAKKSAIPQLVSANSRQRRPDIMIELYNSESVFQKAFIIEVKDRRVRYLYRSDIETDTLKQLIDYRAFNYYDPNKRPTLKTDVVENVLLIYPEADDSRRIYDEDYGFEYIPIPPVDFNLQKSQLQPLLAKLDQFLNDYL